MTADTPFPARPAPQSRLRLGLMILSGLILFGALTDTPALFFDYGHTDRLLIFAQRLTSLKLALSPVIAGAALAFALRDKATHAIAALATLMLVNWLTDLPSIAIHGMELNRDGSGFYALVIAAQWLLYPLLAVAAMSLALRNERLVTAAALTAVPTVVNGIGIVAFTIGIAIYGF